MKPADLLILGIVFGALLVYYLIKLVHAYKLRRQSIKSRRAEQKAQKYLQQQGYTIVAVQKRVPIYTKIDGRSYKNHVKADFIVKKGGFKYVVEVKTGKQVAKPTGAGIRRQLLEYYLIYRTDGVLLLDMENKNIHTVEFKLILPSRAKTWVTHAMAMATGVLLALLLVKGGLIF
ncbi:hypothetical protein JOC37_001898 [Desulfohalotomaculum tongense]|uniref:hypothetical protein n=1 Tax=Desulforadius tongensis TaxID=1216062 RepID=UPI00195DEF0E|nr:hypothetical protein [Desulforadius tongensis]MBM7855501.1 hypothetical protein [Desulforadius tongensis]